MTAFCYRLAGQVVSPSVCNPGPLAPHLAGPQQVRMS